MVICIILAPLFSSTGRFGFAASEGRRFWHPVDCLSFYQACTLPTLSDAHFFFVFRLLLLVYFPNLAFDSYCSSVFHLCGTTWKNMKKKGNKRGIVSRRENLHVTVVDVVCFALGDFFCVCVCHLFHHRDESPFFDV